MDKIYRSGRKENRFVITKLAADRLVLTHDRCKTMSGKEMRTGSVRPDWVIYGSGGDQAFEVYIRAKSVPSWVQHVVQTHIYVENASLAHLSFENALISYPSTVAGQGFLVTDDPSDPAMFNDLYRSIILLTNGETQFHTAPPVIMLIIAHLIEVYYVAIYKYPTLLRKVLRLPEVKFPMTNLQPTLFPITSLNLPIDDTRASKPIGDGGIGYKTPFRMVDGVAKSVKLFLEREGGGEKKPGWVPVQNGNGTGIAAAQVAVETVEGKVGL